MMFILLSHSLKQRKLGSIYLKEGTYFINTDTACICYCGIFRTLESRCAWWRLPSR